MFEREGQPAIRGFVVSDAMASSQSRAGLVLATAAVTALLSAAVCVAAILAPAPAAAVPLVVLICVGCPIFAGWEAPMAYACLRASRTGRKQLASLRHSLEQLPEVEHPLGL
ncbi:MAG: hypothetical protein ACLP01_01970 [Solirubrobacteraceae bacterium]